MSEIILDTLDYTTQNYDSIVGNIVEFLALVYVAYGVLLGIDGYKRYGSIPAAIIVFLCWSTFSIVFLPIYLIIRPNETKLQQQIEEEHQLAILTVNNLGECHNCSKLIKNSAPFCHFCGFRNHVVCQNCHKNNGHESKYCYSCGHVMPETARNTSRIQKLLKRLKTTFTISKHEGLATNKKKDTPKVRPSNLNNKKPHSTAAHKQETSKALVPTKKQLPVAKSTKSGKNHKSKSANKVKANQEVNTTNKLKTAPPLKPAA